VAISENRKDEHERLWWAETQIPSDVLRHRLRERRIAKNLSERALAAAMTGEGFPLDHTAVSKIERGLRRVSTNELFAFAIVLETPLADLFKPLDGEMPIRIGDNLALERHEVANWFVWGPPRNEETTSAQTYMRLTRQIWTMRQVYEDERHVERRREHGETLLRLVKDLWQASPVRPGVMERQALRDEMDSPRKGETG